MQLIIEHMISLLLSILDAAGMMVFFTVFFPDKGKRKRKYIYFLTGIILFTIAMQVIRNGIINMLTTAVVILLFSTLFETSRLQKFFGLVMYFMTVNIVDMSVAGILCYTSVCVITDNLGYQINNPVIYYTVAAASKIFVLMMFAGLRLLFGKMQYLQEDRGVRLQYLMLMITAAICFGITMGINLGWIYDEINYRFAFGINICMVAINAIAYMMYYQMWRLYNVRLEKETLENEYQYRQEYYGMLEQHQQEIRAIRHDMKNRLIGILSSEQDSTEREIQTIMEEITTAEKQLISENPAVNAVLNMKLREAENRQIQSELDIKVPVELPLSSGDIGILLGNLLDNAIEAAEKCELGKRHIWLKICLFHQSLVISCINTTPYKVISLQTTKEDREAHGIGLKSIDKIVEKYHGERHNHSEVDRFLTEINLWL